MRILTYVILPIVLGGLLAIPLIKLTPKTIVKDNTNINPIINHRVNSIISSNNLNTNTLIPENTTPKTVETPATTTNIVNIAPEVATIPENINLTTTIDLPLASQTSTTTIVKLNVPFVVEIPDGTWNPPWNNACEEASIVMVEQYYFGKTKVSKIESKDLMWPLFLFQDKLYGNNRDASAERAQEVINNATAFRATIKENPTLENIKAELNANRPVITVHYGWDLNNPQLRFRRDGSSYHMMVIIGYDDIAKEFIVNDPGNEDGLDFRYDYDIFLASLHDFDYQTRKADGPPRALFTSYEALVKSEDKNAIYLVVGGQRRYITSPELFKIHNWHWADIQTWPNEKLMALPEGEAVRE